MFFEDKWLEHYAAHEMGHALVAWQMPHVSRVHWVKVKRYGGTISFSVKGAEPAVCWVGCIVALAGCAAGTVLKHPTRTASMEGDFVAAQQHAQKIVHIGNVQKSVWWQLALTSSIVPSFKKYFKDGLLKEVDAVMGCAYTVAKMILLADLDALKAGVERMTSKVKKEQGFFRAFKCSWETKMDEDELLRIFGERRKKEMMLALTPVFC